MSDTIITADLLLKIAPQAHDPYSWAPQLDAAAKLYGITSPVRIKMWLAQLCHECAGFTRFKENMNYGVEGLLATFKNYFPDHATAEKSARNPEQIANRVYGARMGNKGVASGDGWKYRGRGPIQRTGRAAYAHDSQALGIDLLNFPDLLCEPEAGSKSAALYWFENGCNELADAGDFKGVTRKINGGLNGLDDRLDWLDHIERIMK